MHSMYRIPGGLAQKHTSSLKEENSLNLHGAFVCGPGHFVRQGEPLERWHASADGAEALQIATRTEYGGIKCCSLNSFKDLSPRELANADFASKCTHQELGKSHKHFTWLTKGH